MDDVCLAFTQTHARRLHFLLTKIIIPLLSPKVGVVMGAVFLERLLPFQNSWIQPCWGTRLG